MLHVVKELVILTFVGRVFSSFTTNAVYQPVGNILDESYERQTVRPINDTSTTLYVTADWNLVSITDFDEINGFIEVSGYLGLAWTASGYQDIVGVVDSENFLNTLIWKPPILLVNSVKYYDEIGSDSSIRISYNFETKVCTWRPWLITKVACSPNVKYYPFDKQSCALRFAVWGYNSSAVTLQPSSGQWSFDFFEENGEWSVEQTTVNSDIISDTSVIEFKIELSRRPLYHVINLISPVVILGIVNSFTFLLPIASGERVGFSVTCFLAYVVFLNTIMSILPTSTNPFSYLSYYTFIMMVFSAGVSLTTIVTVRIHHKEDKKVPEFLSCLYHCFSCKCRQYCTKHPSKGKTLKVKANQITVVEAIEKSVSMVTDEEEEQIIVTWPVVAGLLDKILFFLFLGGQIFFSMAYLLPLFFHPE